MAKYKTHTFFNLTIFLPLCLIGLSRFLPLNKTLLVTFSTSFIFSTLFMTPDLDLANQIKLFSLRGLFSLPFRLYAKFFKHRGVSHVLILGSLTRLLWLFLFALTLFFLYTRALPSKEGLLTFYSAYKPLILATLMGVFLADMAHIFLDTISKR